MHLQYGPFRVCIFRIVSKNSLVVQASFYGDMVVFASDAQGRGFDPQPGQMVYRIFHVCDIYFDRRLKTKCFEQPENTVDLP